VVVLAGHVAWAGRPAVFGRLDAVVPGNLVTIRLTDGTTLRYTVYATRSYLKRALGAEALAPAGTAELRLITCTGRIGADGLHVANLVVFAAREGS